MNAFSWYFRLTSELIYLSYRARIQCNEIWLKERQSENREREKSKNQNAW